MNRKWIPAISLLILIIAGGYLWRTYVKSREVEPVVSERPADESSYKGLEKVSDKVQEGEDAETTENGESGRISSKEAFEIADLLDVSGHNASGSAKRRIIGGETFELDISVENLPNPGEDRFYEVWLAKPDSLDYFSAGILDLALDGNYQLNLVSGNVDLFSYGNVVVTLETLDDGKPEEPILEGTF